MRGVRVLRSRVQVWEVRQQGVGMVLIRVVGPRKFSVNQQTLLLLILFTAQRQPLLLRNLLPMQRKQRQTPLFRGRNLPHLKLATILLLQTKQIKRRPLMDTHCPQMLRLQNRTLDWEVLKTKLSIQPLRRILEITSLLGPLKQLLIVLSAVLRSSMFKNMIVLINCLQPVRRVLFILSRTLIAIQMIVMMNIFGTPRLQRRHMKRSAILM